MNIFWKSGRADADGSLTKPTLLRATLVNSVLILAVLAWVAGCSDYGSNSNPYPTATPPTPPASHLASIGVFIPNQDFEAGQALVAEAAPFDQFGHVIQGVTITFASSNPEVAELDPLSGNILCLSTGATVITATANGITGSHTVVVVKPSIRINEIMSNGDIPGGFVELINPSNENVDLGGWSLTGSNVVKSVVLPAGFTIPAHGYAVVNEINFPEGLRASDAVHLFSRFGVQVDAYSFLGNPQQDFSRCPEIDGPFLVTVPTRKTINNCVDAQTHLITNRRASVRQQP